MTNTTTCTLDSGIDIELDSTEPLSQADPRIIYSTYVSVGTFLSIGIYIYIYIYIYNILCVRACVAQSSFWNTYYLFILGRRSDLREAGF